jgi:hypothetical protein
VIRWSSCLVLAIGVTAFADAGPNITDPDDRSAQVFGLQVQVGQDGSLLRKSRSQSAGPGLKSPVRTQEMISQIGFSDPADEVPDLSGAGRLNLNQEPTPAFPRTDEEIFIDEAANGEHVWQVLPAGLMYKAYLAGEKESRMSSVWTSIKGRDGLLWENTLGGHVGLLRYGNQSAINPEGWQLDLEGAAMPRVDMGHSDDLEACDFRAGFLSTWRYGVNAYKAGYYHLSSHAGDEYLIRIPTYTRLNYVRDSFIVGWTRFLTPDAQAYAEVAYAWNAECGAQPLEFQYGLQYTPMVFGFRGAPFAAINGHTRQDFGWITSLTAQAGWQWRGYTNHLWRFGVQYYKGPALQWEFAGQSQSSVGAGMWFDF